MWKGSGHVYRSALLDKLSWLDHGFGTRTSKNWPDTRPVASLKQVHSNVVVEARESGRLGEGDSLITNRPGLWLGVRTADCYPVILADAENRAVAVVHAGWRGAAGEIVLRTLDAMRAQYGTRSEHVVAAIGPGIGGCCYEVGPEVAARFERWARVSNGKLDLAQVLVAQVRSAGLLHSQVDQAGLCTFCDAVQFHSYRRDGEIAGRMVAAAAMR